MKSHLATYSYHIKIISTCTSKVWNELDFDQNSIISSSHVKGGVDNEVNNTEGVHNVFVDKSNPFCPVISILHTTV